MPNLNYPLMNGRLLGDLICRRFVLHVRQTETETERKRLSSEALFNCTRGVLLESILQSHLSLRGRLEPSSCPQAYEHGQRKVNKTVLTLELNLFVNLQPSRANHRSPRSPQARHRPIFLSLSIMLHLPVCSEMMSAPAQQAARASEPADSTN